MYLVFMAESGDGGLNTANAEFPVYGQAAVVVLDREYAARTDRQLRQFKRSALGSEEARLNPRDIAKQRGPFALLNVPEQRRRFSQQLSDLLASLPLILIAACLNKHMHQREYGPFGRAACTFTLPFIQERLVYLLASRHDGAAVVAQAHGRREDAEFRAVWADQLAHGSYYHSPSEFSSRLSKLDLRPARQNVSGLQLAGLAANACARFVLDPENPNAVFAALSAKLYQGTFSEPDRFGLKVIP
ncbi:MAG TPA: hypothetical protein VMV93_12670 [Chloroflexota bacterium]|nr:hypothetical protein [Chloroflexota bacterium]